MNQRGEITLFSCFLLLSLMALVLACGLELRKSFKLLEQRSHLFLCVKETKGEFNEFMIFMGRTNWGIKNINRASLIMMFIPGLQGAAMDAQKLKKYLVYAQNVRLISYLKTLKDLKGKNCPLDPRMFITPFKTKRDSEEALVLREEKWTYYFLRRPYVLSLTTSSQGFESVNPKLKFLMEEKGAMLSSHLLSRF
ncbi:hypothetical protein [Peredibacter starrii]|uniref:Uncharacterized protein n=1 Tax=Peredibacter starrii TaxID=28202 RepID=A0AAX4HLZ7_9BACT|nr:hypothetical protein [Peredibacter starrii]WPU64236.1 hypothetical protein SOO65_16200 [Peredibacter starrii]